MPITIKFMLIMAVINLMISFVVTYFYEREELKKIRWEIRHEGNFFTEIALRQAEIYFENDFRQIFQARSVFHFMTHDKSDHEIRSILLFDRNAKLMEGFGADKNFIYNLSLVQKAIKNERSIYSEEGPYRLFIYTPIINHSSENPDKRDIIGVFCIDLDYTYRVSQIKQDMLFNAFYFIILGVIVSFIVYYIIYSLVIKPIKKLQTVVHTLGEGDFNALILRETIYKNTNEIENLESGIYKTASRLKKLFEEKDKATQAFKESEELYRSLINTSPDGITLTDLKGNITFVSEKALELHGCKTAGEVLGKSSFNWIDPSEHERAIHALKDVLIGKPRENKEYLLLKQNGKKFFGEINTCRLEDAHGNPKGFISITRDISARKKFEQSLIDAKEQITLVIDSIPVMIAYISSDERYIYANKSYMNAFGKRRDEVIGKTVWEVTAENVYNSIKDKIKEVLSGRTIIFESPLVNPDNKEHYGFITYVPHFDDKGKVKAYFVIIQDTTESRENKEKLIAAKNKAEMSDKLKSEFLAQMSHEIRTPINAILSFTSLIREEVGEMSGELSDSFTIIDRAGQRIIRTIQLILDMSQIQSGTYDANVRNIDLYSDILIKLFVEYKNYAKDKSLSIYLKKETENSEIMGDEYTLRQIFSNLIDNAIKYTFQGSVEITMRKNENNNLCVVICDTGIGMSEEYQNKLFQPFTQEEMGYTRKFEGNGLGLALVKKFCEINRADVFVESEKGKGSAFTVVFKNN